MKPGEPPLAREVAKRIMFQLLPLLLIIISLSVSLITVIHVAKCLSNDTEQAITLQRSQQKCELEVYGRSSCTGTVATGSTCTYSLGLVNNLQISIKGSITGIEITPAAGIIVKGVVCTYPPCHVNFKIPPGVRKEIPLINVTFESQGTYMLWAEIQYTCGNEVHFIKTTWITAVKKPSIIVEFQPKKLNLAKEGTVLISIAMRPQILGKAVCIKTVEINNAPKGVTWTWQKVGCHKAIVTFRRSSAKGHSVNNINLYVLIHLTNNDVIMKTYDINIMQEQEYREEIVHAQQRVTTSESKKYRNASSSVTTITRRTTTVPNVNNKGNISSYNSNANPGSSISIHIKIVTYEPTPTSTSIIGGALFSFSIFTPSILEVVISEVETRGLGIRFALDKVKSRLQRSKDS